MTSSVLGCARQEAAPGRAGTGTPKVDRVVLAVAPPQRESNEMRHMTGPNSWQLRPMYESLIGVDPSTGKLAPQLATEWKVEPNGSSIRFKLRQGIPFHDNWGSFSAQDVPVPWKENVKEDSLTGTRPYWTRTLREIEIVNPQEVVFHLNRPDGHFFESVSEARGNMEAQSLAHLEKQGPATMQSKPLAGTGPYQYKEREQGAYLRFQRVPYTHWRSTPDFPEFEFRWIKEASTRLAALVTGEVHIADLPQDLQPHAAQRGYKLLAGRVPALRTFVEYRCCNFRDINDFSKGYAQPDNPLMDIRVRRALSKAVDRNELNKAFFAGKGELMLVNHFHPTREGWNPEWERRFQETYGHDPGRARALLAEAGHGPNNPLIMNIRVYAVSGYSGSEDLAEAIGGAWRAIGVDTGSDAPTARLSDRAAFDRTLAEAAMRAGARCRFGARVRRVTHEGLVELSDGRAIAAKVVIGADGPRSLAGQAIGRINTEHVETRQITVPLPSPYEATDIFLSCGIPGGYGWLFPKGEVANLGAGVDSAHRHRLKRIVADLHAALVRSGRVGRKILGLTGGLIPVGGMLEPVAMAGETLVLLAGDAAGLTNPVTGAGIAAAVHSGRLAGSAAAAHAAGNAAAAADYENEMESLFKAALDRAARRRAELAAMLERRAIPGKAALRRSWIAYPEYWAA